MVFPAISARRRAFLRGLHQVGFDGSLDLRSRPEWGSIVEWLIHVGGSSTRGTGTRSSRLGAGRGSLRGSCRFPECGAVAIPSLTSTAITLEPLGFACGPKKPGEHIMPPLSR